MLILSLDDVGNVFPIQTTEGRFDAMRYRDCLYRSWNVYKTFAETLRACRAVLDENIFCLMTQEHGQGRLWVLLQEESVIKAEVKKTPAPTYMMYRGTKIAIAPSQPTQQPSTPNVSQQSNAPSVGQMMYGRNKLFGKSTK